MTRRSASRVSTSPRRVSAMSTPAVARCSFQGTPGWSPMTFSISSETPSR
jgi:hypothetical protein